MGSWATATFPLQKFPPLPSCVPRASVSGCCSCKTCFVKVVSLSRRGVFNDYTTRKYSRALVRVVDWGKTSVRSHVGVWEDPDDGSESDYEEEEQEVEDNDLDFESDWEEEKGASVATHTTIKYEDELAEEIEQLLEPDELVILRQNTVPNFEKLSTAKWSLLHTLALAGQIHFLDQLLENGVSIDTIDKDGRTALHVSVIGKKEAVISHLLRKGANPHMKDKDGVTSLHYAVHVGALQTVKLLMKSNVDVNICDNEGWTPLHIAMQSRNRDIAKVLLVYGADPNRKNKDGKTPLDLCFTYGKDFKTYDLAKLLKVVPANRDP